MFRTLAAAALTITTFWGTARAAEEQVIVRVGYADLDLSRDGDIRRLDRRISRSVKEACSGAVADRNLNAMIATRNCQSRLRAAFAQRRDGALSHAAEQARLAANIR